MGTGKRVLAALALGLVLSWQVPADTRKENIDVIIALDKSLSMEKKIGAVESWVNSFILDQLVIPGDFLTVIPFYGKTDILISRQITNDADRAAAKALISGVKGDGRFTDIGNALDALKAQLADKEKDGRQKYVLLLTDGIQEAPPSSKYWSKNGVFNHEFLANTKTIQQKGWKVLILGIGIETAAKQLAQELQGSYGQITTNLTPESLASTAGTLFGMPSVEGAVALGPVNAGGSARVSFKLKSSGLAGDVNIPVGDVTVEVGGKSYSSLLAAPVTITVKKDSSVPVDIPLRFPAGLPAGSSSGTLTFSFSAAERFAPAQVPVTMTVHGWVQSNIALLVPALVLLLILIALIIFLIWRLTRGRPIRFAVLVDDQPVQAEAISLRAGREVFLNDNASSFSIAQKRNARSVARFSVDGGKLSLEGLKEDRFPKVGEFPPEARGKTFALRTETGKNVTLKVQARDRSGAPKSEPKPSAPAAREKGGAPAAGARAKETPKARARKTAGKKAPTAKKAIPKSAQRAQSRERKK
jgi:Mg-chelatase subunit ChlD